MTTDIPIKDPDTTARTVTRINVLNKLGFNGRDDKMFAAWDEHSKSLHIGILDVDEGDFYLYRATDLIGNKWVDISDGGYDFESSTRLGTPLVTDEGSLIVGSGQGSAKVHRFEAGNWEEEPEKVADGWSPLHSTQAQDNKGDIYLGEYHPHGGASTADKHIWKSSDDGETWEIVHTTNEDGHIHGVTPSPYRDLLIISWGDEEDILEFAHKDGSESATVNCLGPGDQQYEPIGAVAVGINKGRSVDSEEEFITLSDSSQYVATRGYAELNDGVLDYRHRYTVAPMETRTDFNPKCMDVVQAREGGYLMVGHLGIYYSPDGWLWDKMLAASRRNDAPQWEQAIAPMPTGYAIPVGGEVWHIPSDVVSDWTVDRGHFEAVRGAGGGPVDTEGTFANAWPAWKFSKLRISGYNDADGVALRVREWSSPVNFLGTTDENIDFENGQKQLGIELVGGRFSIDGRSNLQNDAIIHYTVERY